MFQLDAAVVVLTLVVCVVADPLRQRPLKKSTSARHQVLLTESRTGYPAAGVIPETPFELPTETGRPGVGFPDIVTPQPEEVYGPPQLNGQQPVRPAVITPRPNELYVPPESAPDSVYGHPAVADVPEIEEDIDEDINEASEDLDDVGEDVFINEDGAVISVSSTFEKPARLVYQHFPQSRAVPKVVPARLTSTKIVKPANFIYTARF